jgi:ribosomal protein S18 acetylase RimI-like enzyme
MQDSLWALLRSLNGSAIFVINKWRRRVLESIGSLIIRKSHPVYVETAAALIRSARKEDLDAISMIYMSNWNLPRPQLKHLLDRYLSLFSPAFLVAQIENEIVGYVFCYIMPKRARLKITTRACIYSIAVTKEHRNHGIGKALMQLVLGTLTSMGVSDVDLLVDCENVPAVRMYTRLGFEPKEMVDEKTQKYSLELADPSIDWSPISVQNGI